MAKESGLGWSACTVDDSSGATRAILNDVTNVDIAIPRAVQDVTGLDKTAIERLLLLADFSCTINGVFNDVTVSSHTVGKNVGTTSVERTVTLTVSGQTIAPECFITDYALTRAATGELTFSMPMVLANGTAPAWS